MAMMKFYLFTNLTSPSILVRQDGDVSAPTFAWSENDGRWVERDGFRADLTGMNGACNFTELAEADAKARFPAAF